MSLQVSGSHPVVPESATGDGHGVRLVGTLVTGAIIGVAIAGKIGAIVVVSLIIAGEVVLSLAARHREGQEHSKGR